MNEDLFNDEYGASVIRRKQITVHVGDSGYTFRDCVARVVSGGGVWIYDGDGRNIAYFRDDVKPFVIGSNDEPRRMGA